MLEEAEWRWLEAERLRLGITIEEYAELRWLEEKLCLLVDADFIKGQAHAAAISYKDLALAAAEQGDLAPLRGLIAKLAGQRAAEFINPPPPKDWQRGKRRPQPKTQDTDAAYRFRLRAAYQDAKRIRDLWRERDGRAGRRYGHLAEWYAAHLWNLAEEEVANWKPSGKRKSRAS